MTDSEAIERQVFAYKALKNNNQAFFVDNHDDAERIINALEKQIPNKPIKNKSGDSTCMCGLIIRNRNKINCLYYCHNCGQAIDWSDEE